jgi:EAL domain-containing protein (putative c-di-GMP-specific phosphodiesterase class I)
LVVRIVGYFVISHLCRKIREVRKKREMAGAVNLVVKVHPVVLFQIADSYERRSADNHRVIGTLVGNVDKQSVEITNCFCIPHKEYEERVEADIVYAQEMFELNKKVAPHEALVGWFATGSEITSHSALIHDYYARETKVSITSGMTSFSTIMLS